MFRVWSQATQWTKEAIERLPEHYKKFRLEYETAKRTPVHYRPEPYYYRTEQGELKRRENVPIPLKFPKESNKGLWGGEGVIKGFKKKSFYRTRVPHFWVPKLHRTIIYSEILNEYMEVNVTLRTLTLIDENYGFDNYILKTKPCDLQSQLALDLRRKMLMALVHKEMYPDNPQKRDEIIEKYKEHSIPEEEAEWWGLSVPAALKKQKEIDENREHIPLKHIFRAELVAKLKENPHIEMSVEKKDDRSFLQKINPFSKDKNKS